MGLPTKNYVGRGPSRAQENFGGTTRPSVCKEESEGRSGTTKTVVESPLRERRIDSRESRALMTPFTTMFNRCHREVMSLALAMTRGHKCLIRCPMDVNPIERRQQERLIVAAIREHFEELQKIMRDLEAICAGK